jgi:hypothetical protein
VELRMGRAVTGSAVTVHLGKRATGRTPAARLAVGLASGRRVSMVVTAGGAVPSAPPRAPLSSSTDCIFCTMMRK